MSLQTILIEKQERIIDKWIKKTISVYPSDSHSFIQSKKDQINNPIGHSVREGLTKIFAVICKGADRSLAESAIQQMIKVRAVQDFKPSEAISFMFDLKHIILEQCKREGFADEDFQEWLSLEAGIDSFAMEIMDQYMLSRELLFKVRLNEMKRGQGYFNDGIRCPSSVLDDDQNNQQKCGCKNI